MRAYCVETSALLKRYHAERASMEAARAYRLQLLDPEAPDALGSLRALP